ncbi:unnamed protein product, partial [Iphiclides podalirius]
MCARSNGFLVATRYYEMLGRSAGFSARFLRGSSERSELAESRGPLRNAPDSSGPRCSSERGRCTNTNGCAVIVRLLGENRSAVKREGASAVKPAMTTSIISHTRLIVHTSRAWDTRGTDSM